MTPGGAEPRPPGVLLADKPDGPTSHDVVERARAILGTRGVGHAGTLDPFATGLLILCAGSATRLVEYLHLLDKTYEAVLRLGVETDTHDREGETVAESDAWRDVTAGDLERAAAALTGRIRQRPPAFSAKKVDGRRAHRAARAGEEVELPEEEVRVERLELLGWDPPLARIRVEVGTGTYVRALARDLGRALGCGAHLRSLRRTDVGPFSVDRAAPPPALEEGELPGAAWLSPAEALAWLPSRRLEDEEARRVGHGSRVPEGRLDAPSLDGSVRDPGGLPVALLHEGRLLAVAERLDGQLQPRKVFPDAA